MKWFTADLHLDHKNIIKHCDRPFRNADGEPDIWEMYSVLKNNFCAVIKPGDELFVLGDTSFDPKIAEEFFSWVPGQKFMVWGNHDPKRAKDRERLAQKFVKTADILETTLGDGTKAVLCHYPMLRWNKAHFGSYMLHGHTHGELSYPTPMRILDVGVDKEFMPGGKFGTKYHTRYFPVSEYEVIEYLKDMSPPVHHYHPGDGE